jgi:G3E family GTPase
MENNNGYAPNYRTGLAVMLVIGTDHRGSCAVGAALSGRPDAEPFAEFDVPGVDSGDFGIELAEQLGRDADRGSTGKTVLVLEPAADLMEVALVFEHVVESRDRNAPRVGLSDVVVVSSVREIQHLFFVDHPQGGPTSTDEFDAAEQVACRLEFASLIVLTDLIDQSLEATYAELVLEFLAQLSPAARVISLVDVAALSRAPVRLTRGRAHQLGASMGWQRELSPAADLQVAGGSRRIGTYVFRDPRPFHPGRLLAALEREFVSGTVGRILRSRGFVQLASRAERVGLWSTAGDVLRMDPTAMLSWDIESPPGQELVFFGVDLDGEALSDVLAGCLLTAAELVAGPAVWRAYADEFPVWETEHDH